MGNGNGAGAGHPLRSQNKSTAMSTNGKSHNNSIKLISMAKPSRAGGKEGRGKGPASKPQKDKGQRTAWHFDKLCQ